MPRMLAPDTTVLLVKDNAIIANVRTREDLPDERD
jgi:hypothetical protein